MSSSPDRRILWRALHKNVLAVAVEGKVGDWAAYIVPVPGKNHDEEAQLWKNEGSKLPQDLAEAIFPSYAARYTWRD